MKMILSVLTALFLATAAQAGVSVLGVELGKSSVQEVRSAIGKKTQIEDQGTNRYSGGVQFKTDGTGYDIDGLSKVTYIFDAKDRLAGVLMTMEKNRFDTVFKYLARKYKVQKQQRPFVGDQFARFKSGHVTIELDAPHMSFEMSARYLRDDLIRAFKAIEAESARKKNAAESNQF